MKPALRAAARTDVGRRALRRAAQAGALPGRTVRHLPVRAVFDVTTPTGSVFRYETDEADPIGTSLHWDGLGRWEQEVLPVLAPLLAGATGFLDIGACTGAYSLLVAASSSAQVVAIEPVPRNFDRLRRNIALNGWQDRISAHQAAAARSAGVARMSVPGRDVADTAHLVLSDSEHRQDGTGGVIDVQTVTVDGVSAGLDVDLVKIDVEGFEQGVLEGGMATWRRCRPTMVIEFLPWTDASGSVELLTGLGYSLEWLTLDGPQRVDRPDTSMSGLYNYLARPL